jgi:DNA polymerase I-like protein with 3'-5' exonuclease and polymerase domains
MKYTTEVTKRIVEDYQAGIPVEQIAENLQAPLRSVIAKLSSVGVYQKKRYLNKQGHPPVKKSEIIDQLALLLECDAALLDSLEKVNKLVLNKLVHRLQSNTPKSSQKIQP